MRYALRIMGEITARNKKQRIMYYLSNILPICRIVSNYFDLSNDLYNSELDQMGGVNFYSQKQSAHIAPI